MQVVICIKKYFLLIKVSIQCKQGRTRLLKRRRWTPYLQCLFLDMQWHRGSVQLLFGVIAHVVKQRLTSWCFVISLWN